MQPSHTRHLRTQYARQLPEKIDEIVDAWRTMRHAGVVSEGCLRQLAENLHSLGGSASVFGYSALSEAAQRFEMFLRGVDDSEARPVSAWLTEQVESFLSWLVMALRLNEAVPPADGADDGHQKRASWTEGTAPRRSRAIVYLLDSVPCHSGGLSLDLEVRGYRPRCFDSTEAFAAAMAEQTPDVAVVRLSAESSSDSGTAWLAELGERGLLHCPVILISRQNDHPARLQAVRHGVSHYFAEPVEIRRITQTLDGLIGDFNDIPYRIALLQVDSDIGALFRQWLEEAGMHVTPAENAESLLGLLDSWHPELLLVDLHMPDYNGPEVATVVRQWQGYNEIPILFVAGDSAEEKQLVAGYRGGDTFLFKPVARARLIESIKMRVRRYRRLQWSSRQAQLAVDELQEFKEALDQHAIVSITDRAGTIIYANRKFCEISGYSHVELIGQNHRIVKGGMAPAIYQDMWRTIAGGRVWRGELRNRRKDGRYYWVESSIVPLALDEHGVPERYIGIRTEVTDLKEAQEALAESEERFKRSQYYANAGTWDWNIASGEVICSERVGALLGGTEGVAGVSYDDLLAAVYAEDKPLVSAAITACLNSGVALDVEHRVLWPDGQIHWLHHKGDVVRSTDGRPQHLLGVVTDVTLRKSAEEALLKQKDLLEVLRQAVLRYIGGDEAHDIAAYLLRAMLDLTDSQYGILAEVKFDEYGEPYLYTHAMIDAEGTSVGSGERCDKGGHMEIRNLHSLLGTVLTSGKPVFSNDVPHDPRSSGCNHGHPPLHTFLGAPVYYGGRIVAMYGIANRSAGYDQALLEFLYPFDATVAVVMDAMRRAEDKRALQERWLQAKDEAERANRAKTDFLSRMSHELRTPLNAVLGFAQLLTSDPDEPLSASQQESVDQILQAGWHLLKLINEVLDLSRIESGKLSLEMRNVAVLPLLEDCMRLVAPMAAQQSISVALDEARIEPGQVFADGVRLKQILLNLLSNAIKYNRPKGKVSIACTEPAEGGRIRVAVSDTGAGLTEEQQSHLFEAFNRIGAEHTDIEGTGIGLVIAKRLVEMMGGEIGVVSRLGEGSTFWLELPSSQAAEDSDEAANTSVLAGIDPNTGELSYKVLYVEDNPANLRVVERLLARYQQYDLIVATTAEQGLEMARSQQPDVVLMDINLPGMDGFAALEWLRNTAETRHIPVLALSANAMPADVQRGLDAGFDAYLAKPVKVDEVMDALRRFTEQD
jgi:PAS domain S-box-containing protein